MGLKSPASAGFFLCFNEADELGLKEFQKIFQAIPPFQHLAFTADDQKHPLFFAQIGVLNDPVGGTLRSTPEKTKGNVFARFRNGIILQMPGTDKAAIYIKNQADFLAGEIL